MEAEKYIGRVEHYIYWFVVSRAKSGLKIKNNVEM